MTQIINDPSRKGEIAASKRFFGRNKRYAVAPVYSRFENIAWFVWDAETPDRSMDRDPVMGYPAAVIRICETREQAMAGLV